MRSRGDAGETGKPENGRGPPAEVIRAPPLPKDGVQEQMQREHTPGLFMGKIPELFTKYLFSTQTQINTNSGPHSGGPNCSVLYPRVEQTHQLVTYSSTAVHGCTNPRNIYIVMMSINVDANCDRPSLILHAACMTICMMHRCCVAPVSCVRYHYNCISTAVRIRFNI